MLTHDVTSTATVNLEPFRAVTDAIANFTDMCSAVAVSFDGLSRRLRRPSYKRADNRKRPKRIAKKISARYGAAHQVDYVYAMVDTLRRNASRCSPGTDAWDPMIPSLKFGTHVASPETALKVE
jgi:hypothetical protein